jgi:hypothetical protein
VAPVLGELLRARRLQVVRADIGLLWLVFTDPHVREVILRAHAPGHAERGVGRSDRRLELAGTSFRGVSRA